MPICNEHGHQRATRRADAARQAAEGRGARQPCVFREPVPCFVPSALAICLRILPQRSEAEDVLQEVFATVWRKAAQYDADRAGAMSWLGMIARNKAIDRIRSQPQARRFEPLSLTEEIADPIASPQQDAQSAAERERLRECLKRLDARRRSLIRAAFFDGSTYEELAARIGSPLGTVKSWIRRGLLQL